MIAKVVTASGETWLLLEEGGPWVRGDSVHPAPSGDPREWPENGGPLDRACWVLGQPVGSMTGDQYRKALSDLIFWVRRNE